METLHSHSDNQTNDVGGELQLSAGKTIGLRDSFMYSSI